jgi:hypothetical protein
VGGPPAQFERTRASFFERVEPFETAFMALFGRRCLPHRSRALAARLPDVDRPCLEAFRTLFQQHTFARCLDLGSHGLRTPSHHDLCEALYFPPRDGTGRASTGNMAMRPSSASSSWRVCMAFREAEVISSWSIPRGSRVLAHPPTASVTRMNSGEVVELFDGGWLEPSRGLPHVRVIVVRHPAPPKGEEHCGRQRCG